MLARRSCLSVPGSSEPMLAKAAGVGADEVVVDLEDSVAPESKEAARELAAQTLSTGSLAQATVAVRLNSLGSRWWREDLERLAPRVDSVVLPKAESAADVEEVAAQLDSLGGPAQGVRIQALIETAAGLQHVDEIAAGSERLDALTLGYLDLAASLGRPLAQDEPSRWLYAQERLVVAARSEGLQAIDGPHLATRDEDGLRRAAAHVRDLGYDGKWAIHPAQVPVLNAVFSPDEGDLARAQAVLDALDAADGGAVEVGGQMVDEASRKLALGVVARARGAGG